MTSLIAIIGAIGAYLLTMTGLLFLAALLGAGGGAFGLLNVQPYRGMLKLTIIAMSAGAGYLAFHALA